MRNPAKVSPLRLACVCAVMAYLSLGLVGCGGDSDTKTGKVGELPPGAIQANKNMEDFMKNQPKK